MDSFVQITREEFESFLETYLFAREKTYGESEYVYLLSWGTNNDWCLKVYSSITPRASHSREKGTDAIRVVLLVASTRTDGNHFPVWKSPHVKRIKTWRTNLLKRIEEGLYRGMAEMEPRYCPRCKNPLIIRETKDKKFFIGCTNWNPKDGCKYTRNLGEK